MLLKLELKLYLGFNAFAIYLLCFLSFLFFTEVYLGFNAFAIYLLCFLSFLFFTEFLIFS